MVNHGEADWVTSYDGEVPIPTWNICYRGRTGKTPRSHTLERAHIERALERRDQLDWFNDEGIMAQNIEGAAMGGYEQMELFEFYHDLEMESRYRLFRGTNYIAESAEEKQDAFQTFVKKQLGLEHTDGKIVVRISKARKFLGEELTLSTVTQYFPLEEQLSKTLQRAGWTSSLFSRRILW